MSFFVYLISGFLHNMWQHSKDDDPWEQKNSRTNDVKSPSKLLDEPATQDCQSRNPLAGTLAHADAIGCETVAKAPANPSPNSTFGIVAKAEAEQSCPPSLRPAPNDGMQSLFLSKITSERQKHYSSLRHIVNGQRWLLSCADGFTLSLTLERHEVANHHCYPSLSFFTCVWNYMDL